VRAACTHRLRARNADLGGTLKSGIMERAMTTPTNTHDVAVETRRREAEASDGIAAQTVSTEPASSAARPPIGHAEDDGEAEQLQPNGR
jgi:hypothetical protein